MSKKILTNLLLAGCLASTAFAQPRETDPLDAARELYASARYDEALAMLNGLRPTDAGPALDRRSIEQYRSLCLLALGRGQEAEAAIAAVVAADPLFQPSEAEAAPRVRAAFTDVRQRLLPEIAAARYATAKATYDRREYALAKHHFDELLKLLNDPAMGGRLGDLKVLTAGFFELAAAAATPPPPPPEEKKAPAPLPVPAQPQPEPGKIYGTEDNGVSLPVVLRQDFPNVPVAIAGQTREKGRLEIVTDEQGRVVSSTVRQSMHPLYDQLIVAASREWRYRPALVGGVPVKFRKTIVIAVSR